jgi:hypothetical protein
VGTKSALSVKNPRLNYTPEDIERNHGDAPGLVNKLKTALEHLPKVAPKVGVYQGDFMYDKDSVHTHNGEHNFTPNTLQYSVPEKDDEGKKISNAKMGITVHTRYHGREMSKLEPNLNPDTHNFKEHADVHMIPDKIGEVLHSGANQKSFENHMKTAESIHDKAHPDMLANIQPHAEHIAKYINKSVREGVKPSVGGYREHLMQDGEKAVGAAVTAKGKQLSHMNTMSKLHHVESHEDQFDAAFRMHHHLQKAKDALIDTLNQSSPFEHSIGGKPSKPEGFVVVHDGHPVKLVNRAEFSKANFNAHK